jgi:2-polyprenyl-6-methoxyphenol hydroxylase-like FAD-dependent oxidoreductase
MSPVGGQGINIALRDVLVAANKLVPAIRSGLGASEIDRACTDIQALRVPEVAKVQSYQRQPPRILFRNSWWSEALIRFALMLAGSNLPRGSTLPPIARTLLYGDGEVSLNIDNP